MDIKTNLLLKLMHDNNYFKDLNSYLREMVEQDKLSYSNLKYLYNNLYINKSLFIKQNIFPVSQFLINGYSTEEAEKLAKLLPDAYELAAVFCYEKKEKGKLFNKLFMDLEFVYMKYDYYRKIKDTSNKAYEIVKDDIESTTIKQREIEVKIERQELDTKEKLEEAYDTIDKEMKKLRYEFEQDTGADEKLVEYFKNDDPKDRFKSIMFAGTILGGIQLRNIWRENVKLNNEKEEFPYNEKQREMIHKYNRLEETIGKLEYYAEYIFEDEEELQ